MQQPSAPALADVGCLIYKPGIRGGVDPGICHCRELCFVMHLLRQEQARCLVASLLPDFCRFFLPLVTGLICSFLQFEEEYAELFVLKAVNSGH